MKSLLRNFDKTKLIPFLAGVSSLGLLVFLLQICFENWDYLSKSSRTSLTIIGVGVLALPFIYFVTNLYAWRGPGFFYYHFAVTTISLATVWITQNWLLESQHQYWNEEFSEETIGSRAEWLIVGVSLFLCILVPLFIAVIRDSSFRNGFDGNSCGGCGCISIISLFIGSWIMSSAVWVYSTVALSENSIFIVLGIAYLLGMISSALLYLIDNDFWGWNRRSWYRAGLASQFLFVLMAAIPTSVFLAPTVMQFLYEEVQLENGDRITLQWGQRSSDSIDEYFDLIHRQMFQQLLEFKEDGVYVNEAAQMRFGAADGTGPEQEAFAYMLRAKKASPSILEIDCSGFLKSKHDKLVTKDILFNHKTGEFIAWLVFQSKSKLERKSGIPFHGMAYSLTHNSKIVEFGSAPARRAA